MHVLGTGFLLIIEIDTGRSFFVHVFPVIRGTRLAGV